MMSHEFKRGTKGRTNSCISDSVAYLLIPGTFKPVQMNTFIKWLLM